MNQIYKGGVPLVPKLPPTLYMHNQLTILRCSKAPRGLSVLLRVTRIFTGATFSPSFSLRQFPSRYAFHAGRYLADKEFRSCLPFVFRRGMDYIIIHKDHLQSLAIASIHFAGDLGDPVKAVLR